MKTAFKGLIILLLLQIAALTQVLAQNQNNFEISKSLDIYANVLRELNLNYVDEISPGELNQIAIDAMLNALDPYTVFVPESKIEDFQLMTTGEYGGIGSLIQEIGDYVYISEPYEGFPAQEAGLRAGDRILEINGLDTKGKSSPEISELLKGQPGTTLILLIGRDGVTEPIEVELIRKRIRIDNIPYHTVYEGGIGYLRLSGFTQKAATEVKKVMEAMHQENDSLNGLIIDLRGNGGGLLNEAVDITNLFIDKGSLVVTTKGKATDRTVVHRTRNLATEAELPVVVMVNESSASASEIVAGALQDYDRAVIIGQRTFGKGLVQNVLPLTYNTQMKVTVAQYFIPSGRGIQAIDYKHKNGNGSKIPDSLFSSFRTRNGRMVYDGGGILPDIQVEPREFSLLSSQLFAQHIIFLYANEFARENTPPESIDNFVITDDIYEDFVQFVKEQGFEHQTESEEAIQLLRETATDEAYLHAITDQIQQLEDQLKAYKANDLYKYRAEIEDLLRVEIATRYFYQKGKIMASLVNDKELKEARAILNDRNRYEELLKGTTD
jgi:carboxyl-terminal processing protease